ncbi:MAG: HAD-IIIA family hydrolase [bacterium]|nr:HAD-IIIA family hydrolase [bacterium]
MDIGDVEEIDDREMRLMESEKDLNIKLMRTMAKLSDAEDTLKRWRAELEIVASKGGHNLCHIWIPELLKRTLGHMGNFPDPEKLTKEQFKLGCKFYQDDIFGADKVPLCSGKMFNRQAVFLDRDGTLIKAVHRPNFPEYSSHKKEITAPFQYEELVFEPNVHKALAMLKTAGFLRIMITNQPDVAHGYMSEEEWQKIHTKVITTLDLDDFHMCRHTSESGCPFHKPSPTMLLSMADRWGINLSESFMIGDTDTDMKAGKSAGCGTILIDKFYNSGVEADWRAADLLSAAIVAILTQQV